MEKPYEHLPIQIRRLQKCQENLKSWQLKPTYVQWLSENQVQMASGYGVTQEEQLSSVSLSTDEIKHAVDTLAVLGCEVFSVIGTNPFLRKDLFEVLGYAARKGIKLALTIDDLDKAEKYLDQMEGLKLDSLLIGVDGYRDTHDQFRGKKGDYKQCLDYLKDCYDIDIPVIGVSVMIREENVDDIPKIIDDVYNNGGNQIRIQPLLSPRGKRNSPEVAKKAFRKVYEARRDGFNIEASEGFGFLGPLETMVRTSSFFCGCGWDTFTIMPDGQIKGCPAINLSRYTEGNIQENDLKQIWFSQFKRFREEAFWELPSKCKNCQHLPICRGGCWLFRAYNQNPCFLSEAIEVVKQVMG